MGTCSNQQPGKKRRSNTQRAGLHELKTSWLPSSHNHGHDAVEVDENDPSDLGTLTGKYLTLPGYSLGTELPPKRHAACDVSFSVVSPQSHLRKELEPNWPTSFMDATSHPYPSNLERYIPYRLSLHPHPANWMSDTLCLAIKRPHSSIKPSHKTSRPKSFVLIQSKHQIHPKAQPNLTT